MYLNLQPIKYKRTKWGKKRHKKHGRGQSELS